MIRAIATSLVDAEGMGALWGCRGVAPLLSTCLVIAVVLVGGSTIWFDGGAAVHLDLAIGGIVLLVATRGRRAELRKTIGEMS